VSEDHVVDQAERLAALDVTRSFIVQAPAGSGKTALLVERYLRLLERVERPEEIVAITFTRKAAAEMRKRVTQKVSPDLAARLRIQTIDALCASLTSQMPVLARFGAQPAIAEDASDLYREAAARTLAGLTPPVTRLLAHLDNNVAEATALVAEMLARRDQWLRQTGEVPTRAALEAALAEERARRLRRAQALYAQASPELAKEVLTQKGEWRKRPRPAPPELQAIPGLREALVALLRLPPERYTEPQWQVLEAILALLRPAVAQLLILFGEKHEVDFTQVAHGALAALGTPDAPTDLLLSLDHRVHHLLVDEFQDTSNSQWELLERLTAGWEPGDGRTVFVVGDPMQSIYRFRDAQVGLFLHARDHGLPNVPLERLTLATNFRSQGAIVEWVNHLFPQVLPAREDEVSGAVAYAPSVPFHAPHAEAAPAMELVAAREDEARRVVELVATARGKTAILVRNRSHLDHIVPALKTAGLRFRAVEIEQLGEKQVVQDLYALTRALTHLADRVAWLAILRAPWCGLALDELSAFFEGREETVWERMQAETRFARMVAVLKPALDGRLRGTLRDRVEGVWLALGGPACVADATDLEDAEIFFDELERLETAGELEDFGLLAESLARLYALPDVEAGPEAVEIMTIHKAKGLEFDTVIVPGLDRAPRSGRRPLFAWRALAGGRLLLAPIDETGGEKEPLYAYVRTLDRDAEDVEAGRLFYVAATRAESRLFLLGCVKFDGDGEPKPPAKRSLLGLAWDALEGSVPLPGPAAGETAEAALPGGELRRLSSEFDMPEAPAAVQWSFVEEGGEEESSIEFSWAGETARHVGTVVHAWLRRMAEDALKGWTRETIESLRPLFAAELEWRGVRSSERGDAAALVATALMNAIADERGRWLLGPHAQAWSEYRFRTRDGRRLVADRRIREASGEHWVVDYKTSRHEGADVEGFLDRERERYAPQLQRYADHLDGARMGLYFPLLRGWREWR